MAMRAFDPLIDFGTYRLLAAGISGQKFEAAEPFPMGFDPRQLLPVSNG